MKTDIIDSKIETRITSLQTHTTHKTIMAINNHNNTRIIALNSDIKIFGDFQSCPQTFPSKRLSQPNVLTNCLENFLDRQALIPIEFTQGTGPSNTYNQLTLNNKSYTDHICISQPKRSHLRY